jgi:methionine synthase I (cobalamin-dependent)
VAYQLLKAHGTLLLDGAMGTELIARGLETGTECPEVWNLKRPEEVAAVHSLYVAAGAEALETNSFGASRTRLRRFGREAEVTSLCRAAVAVAKRAGSGLPLIGSIGPTGDAPDPTVERDYSETAAALAEEGVDAIHLETQLHPMELEMAVRGARQGAPGLPVWTSITVHVGASGLETPLGVPIGRMVAAMIKAEPDVVGLNCSLDGERMASAIGVLRSALSQPLVLQPQAKTAEKCALRRSSESPERFAKWAYELVKAGAAAIGGCCGVGPAGIASLALLLSAKPVEVEL